MSRVLPDFHPGAPSDTDSSSKRSLGRSLCTPARQDYIHNLVFRMNLLKNYISVTSRYSLNQLPKIALRVFVYDSQNYAENSLGIILSENLITVTYKMFRNHFWLGCWYVIGTCHAHDFRLHLLLFSCQYIAPQLQGGPGSVRLRLRFGDGTVRAVAVFGSGSSSKKGVLCVSVQLSREDGSGSVFGSLKTVPAVPVPRSVPGKKVPTVPVSRSGSVPGPLCNWVYSDWLFMFPTHSLFESGQDL